jgi:toxin ParE1/3/4
MAKLILAAKAQEDLAAIADFTIETFGTAQARRYSDALKASFALLASNPQIGRDYSHIRPHLRRFESRSHSIYYFVSRQGVLVARVLHVRQDPARYL